MSDHSLTVMAELLHLVTEAGWIPAETMSTSQGVTVRFRDAPYTSDWPGMKTRHASGISDLDAFRVLLNEIESERRQAGGADYQVDPKAYSLDEFAIHQNFWPGSTSENQRAADIEALSRDLARKHASLGYENLIFRMHHDAARGTIARWVAAGFLDRVPNIAVERIRVVSHPRHDPADVSISVTPLADDELCV